jgi:hypothetical protein
MRIRTGALIGLMLTRLAAPAAAHEADTKAPAASAQTDPAKLMDPMSAIMNSPAQWSVSKTEAGCFLLSPHRNGSSNLAIGRHPRLGLGLFVVSFGLSVSNANTGEPVIVKVDGRDINGIGRIVGVRLLFVPLATPDVESSLSWLKDTAALWVVVRNTWILHSGQGVADAVAKYRQDCTGSSAKSG